MPSDASFTSLIGYLPRRNETWSLMSIFDQALHIPAETGLLHSPAGGFSRVLLPLRARASWRMAVVALMALMASGASLALGVAFAVNAWSLSNAPAFELAAAAFFLGSTVPPACVFGTALRDHGLGLGFGKVCLAVDRDGITDTRLGAAPFRWAAIERVEGVAGASGLCGVRLTLVAESAPAFNPFRPGGWSARWSGRRRERLVAILLLDQRPHVLAQTILTLAARNGIATGQPPPPYLSEFR